jgi:hypothetical protein
VSAAHDANVADYQGAAGEDLKKSMRGPVSDEKEVILASSSNRYRLRRRLQCIGKGLFQLS